MDFCSIASGSSGNCIYVGSDHTAVLVDTGISGKKIAEGMKAIGRKPEELNGILITHEHSDHIKGLGVMARKYGIPIYTTPGTREAICKCGSLGVIEEGLFHEIHADEGFAIQDLEIMPFRISHDAAQPVAYRIKNGDKSVAVATDMGCYSDYIIDHLQGLDGILLESNHDINMLQVGKYPYRLKQRILGERGHLSNASSGQLLSTVLNDHLKGIFLGHLSQENNLPELAFETVRVEIMFSDSGYHPEDLPIRVARRSAPSELVEF